MSSLISSLKDHPATPASKMPSTAGTKDPITFNHYANAQTEFTKTLPLIANENAFLGDVFSS